MGKVEQKEYPYKAVLADSKFYPDEAYFEGKAENDLESYANGCDMCLEPAEFMTFSSEKLEPPEGEAYYICSACVKKFGIEDMLEEPGWLEGHKENCDCGMCQTERLVASAVKERVA